MIFDTDVIIWVERGSLKAANWIDQATDRYISVLTYMELLQRPQDRKQQSGIKNFLRDFEFKTLPLTQNIGSRAAVYIEEYSLSHGISAVDAMIAATAVEYNFVLCSANVKHFKAIADLSLKTFKP